MKELGDYLGVIKSPYEQDINDQVDMQETAYLKWCCDKIVSTIGTTESKQTIIMYMGEIKSNTTESEFNLFLDNCISRVVEVYQMNYLMNSLLERTIPDKSTTDHRLEILKFMEGENIVKLVAKCLSKMDVLFSSFNSQLPIFISSDYDSFLLNISKYKRINPYVKDYFANCSKSDGVRTLLTIVKKEIVSIIILQST